VARSVALMGLRHAVITSVDRDDLPDKGAGAFVGSNSSLVAPVKIGSGAYIGSGSVITKEVPADALAVERSQQTNREDGAKRYREIKTRDKPPKAS